MKEITYVIIGAGHAGIHAAESIVKAAQKRTENTKIILIDKQPYHLRKVLLFKPAVSEEDITIPLNQLFSHPLQHIQGEVTRVVSKEKYIRYLDTNGMEQRLDYDYLVIAVGSIVRKPEPHRGGIALTDLESAKRIREQWLNNIQKAAAERNEEERQRLLSIAVAGAGITGIEVSAELADGLRKEAAKQGLNPELVRIYLLNSDARLFGQGPAKVGKRLERILHSFGVQVLHGVKALQEKEGSVSLSDGTTLAVGLCIWTLGLIPNPILQGFGLPLSTEGQLIVDPWYRVEGAPGVYSTGDCAHIVDPSTGKADQKTCKEAAAQAKRLGPIVFAHMEGRPGPVHKGHFDFFCFGLGE